MPLNPDGLHLYERYQHQGRRSKVLTPAHFEIEIDDRNRPVPIRAGSTGQKKTNGRASGTESHALIVTGYKYGDA